MKLLFKQKIFSWFDSYDIFDENENTIYTVKGQLAFGHCFKIFDINGIEVGRVKQKLFSFRPKFEMYYGEQCVGCIKREIAFFKPRFSVDCNGWCVEGNFFEHDYKIFDCAGRIIATISKRLFQLTDTYIIDVDNPQDALNALMLVVAIDAEKSSRNN